MSPNIEITASKSNLYICEACNEPARDTIIYILEVADTGYAVAGSFIICDNCIQAVKAKLTLPA